MALANAKKAVMKVPDKVKIASHDAKEAAYAENEIS